MKTTELINRAKECVLNGAVQGYTSKIFIEAAKNDPQTFEELLDEVGQQATDPDSHKATLRTYGEKLTGIAIAYAMIKKEENLTESMKVRGGLADKLTVKDIAIKFNIPVTKIIHQLEMGKDVEMEHTKDIEVAEDIAMDHLAEMPDYYSRLDSMETKALRYWGKREIKEMLHKALKTI